MINNDDHDLIKLSCFVTSMSYYISSFMKQDKVFVRYKVQQHEQQQSNYNRQYKKNTTSKKVYAQKSYRPREAIRQIINSYEPLSEIPNHINQLIQTFPKFFQDASKPPEKDHNEYLNEFVIYNAKKYLDNLHHRRQTEFVEEDSQPDWNSDDEMDYQLESKQIDVAVVEKVVEKIGEKQPKKNQILKRHQKEFLEEYFRNKRLMEQNQQLQVTANNAIVKEPIQQKHQQIDKLAQKMQSEKEIIEKQKIIEKPKIIEKQKNSWSEYQQNRVNNFIDMGFMTKVDDNQEIEAVLAQDDGLFDDQEQENDQKQQQKSSSDEQDDIFGDQHPTTIKTSLPVEPEIQQADKKVIQGTVFINDQVFTKIAEEVGLYPGRCVWIISNQTNKFKVSTEYMDTIYRKQKMNQILPLISLNHSEFVNNEDVQSLKGIQAFRNYNARRDKNGNYQSTVSRFKHQFKEKGNNKKK